MTLKNIKHRFLVARGDSLVRIGVAQREREREVLAGGTRRGRLVGLLGAEWRKEGS